MVYNNNIRLSIIIPVYNVDKYISRCIDSVVFQDLSETEYEIIIVNDGSLDNSVSIVEKYTCNNSNIKIVHRPNGGLSAARNTGLSHATGRYVWFVDSDDWVESNCIGEILTFAENNNLDVLCFGAKIYHSAHVIKEIPSATEKQGYIFNGHEFVVNVNTIPSAWSALYRRQYLVDNNLMFYEGILHEDQEFTPRAYCLANRIAYLHKPVYYYYQREGSIMKSSQNEKRCRDLLAVADSLYAFANKNLMVGSPVYIKLIQKVNFCLTQSIAFYDTSFFDYREYSQRGYYPLHLKGINFRTKTKYLLLNTSIPMYLLFRRLVNVKN